MRYTPVILLIAMSTVVSASQCSEREAYAAEVVVDYLDSWRNVHNAFKQFSMCDQGGVAEGYSNAIAKILVNQWSSLSSLYEATKVEPGYEGFILRHINESIDENDLEAIYQSATNRCPPNNTTLCEKLAHAASRAVESHRSRQG